MRTVDERFWAKVSIGSPDECWPWLGCRVRGHGQFQCENHKRITAHRFIYRATVGEIPEGKMVDHICHNRACVNPSHLRLCSPAQNGWNRRADIDNPIGIKGVHRNRTRWRARIEVNGIRHELGTFSTKEEASVAYGLAAASLQGEFAYRVGEDRSLGAS